MEQVVNICNGVFNINLFVIIVDQQLFPVVPVLSKNGVAVEEDED